MDIVIICADLNKFKITIYYLDSFHSLTYLSILYENVCYVCAKGEVTRTNVGSLLPSWCPTVGMWGPWPPG